MGQRIGYFGGCSDIAYDGENLENAKRALSESLVREFGEEWYERHPYIPGAEFWHENVVCENRDRAYGIIERRYRNEGAVLYCEPMEDGPEVKRLLERLEAAERKAADIEHAASVCNRTTRTVTCPTCMSRITIAFYKGKNDCPVCGEDMRSPAAIRHVTDAKRAAWELRERVSSARVRQGVASGRVKWLVRYRIPC